MDLTSSCSNRNMLISICSQTGALEGKTPNFLLLIKALLANLLYNSRVFSDEECSWKLTARMLNRKDSVEKHR